MTTDNTQWPPGQNNPRTDEERRKRLQQIGDATGGPLQEMPVEIQEMKNHIEAVKKIRPIIIKTVNELAHKSHYKRLHNVLDSNFCYQTGNKIYISAEDAVSEFGMLQTDLDRLAYEGHVNIFTITGDIISHKQVLKMLDEAFLHIKHERISDYTIQYDTAFIDESAMQEIDAFSRRLSRLHVLSKIIFKRKDIIAASSQEGTLYIDKRHDPAAMAQGGCNKEYDKINATTQFCHIIVASIERQENLDGRGKIGPREFEILVKELMKKDGKVEMFQPTTVRRIYKENKSLLPFKRGPGEKHQ